MKALTLTQPWASLVSMGMKQIETRSWSTAYRGPLAIHAGAGLGPVGGMRGLRKFTATLRDNWQVPIYAPEVLPRGKIIAVAWLVDVQLIRPDMTEFVSGKAVWELTPRERAFGDFTPGRYAWLLNDVRDFLAPVAAKGKLGLWDVDL